MVNDYSKDKLPLSGLTVLEIGIIVSAPTAGLILADLGADVIKIENTDGGDPNRENTGAPGTGQFDFLNRNKRSVCINLKNEKGREIFLRMAKEADVIIENLGPGAVKSLGISFDDVKRVNQRLIYCSIKGFGKGIYSGRKMTDYPAQAESGLAYMTGLKDRPMRAGASVLDMMAANMIVISILSSLFKSLQSGIFRPEHVTVGMFETGSFLMAPVISRFYQNGEIPMPLNEVNFRWAVHDFFNLDNGKKIFLGIINERQWNNFLKIFDDPDLKRPEFSNNDRRLENKAQLFDTIQRILLKEEHHSVIRRLSQADLLFASLNRPDELINHPHLSPKMLEYSSCFDTSRIIRLPSISIESSNYSFSVFRDAPALGEFTEDLLRQMG